MSLVLQHISKSVAGAVHIHPLDLELADASFNVLLGTTLSGKTTLMQLMAGIQAPSGGRLIFRGQDVTRQPVQRRNVSMVYQQFVNYPHLSVYDNIASPLRVAGMAEAEISNRVARAADLLRLSPMLKRRPSELSGGQQQRTAIARAIVKDSDLILFDEPLANLDYKLREELRDELPRLFAGRRAIVVYATTEPSEALLFGGQVITLSEGRITDFGPTSHVYRRPRDLLTAQVTSEPPLNIARVRKAQGQVHLQGGGAFSAAGTALHSVADGTYIFGIRAHHVLPVTQAAPASAHVMGKVVVTEISGSESVIHFSTLDRSWASLAPGIHAYDVGQDVQFKLDLAGALFFAEDGRLIEGNR